MEIDLGAIPRPESVPLDRWLQTFPSFGYILSVAPANLPAVIARFTERGIHAANIGAVTADQAVCVTLANEAASIWDFTRQPFMGCSHA
jgi:uncharacterized protein